MLHLPPPAACHAHAWLRPGPALPVLQPCHPPTTALPTHPTHPPSNPPQVASNLKIAKDTRRKQGLTALLETLLKLQQASKLHKALKWAAAAGVGALGRERAPPRLQAQRAAPPTPSTFPHPRPQQGGAGEWRVCRGLLAVRTVRAVHGGAGGRPQGGPAGALARVGAAAASQLPDCARATCRRLRSVGAAVFVAKVPRPAAPPRLHYHIHPPTHAPTPADGDLQPAVRGDDAAAGGRAGGGLRRLPSRALHAGAGGIHVPGQLGAGAGCAGCDHYCCWRCRRPGA